MSIAAANLFTRNVYRDFLKPSATDADEARVGKPGVAGGEGSARWRSCSSSTSRTRSTSSLLGGVWILQTFPAIVFGLYTRWFHRWALLVGWAAGMVYGTVTAYGVANKAVKPPVLHFGGSTADLPLLGHAGYIGLTAFVINVVVAVVLTLVLRATRTRDGVDETNPADYRADAGDPRVRDLPELTTQ
nr:hypothetical protein [Angustibacter aerolatus]